MRARLFLTAIVATLGLAACETQTPESYKFGEAVAHNMAVQIINPEGSRVNEIPQLDGERVARARDRLMKEEKKDSELRIPAFVLSDQKSGK